MKKGKIKIVYLINGLSEGGAEMMLYRLLERLDRNMFQPEVVVLLKFSSQLQEKTEALGIKVHVIGVRSKLDLGAFFRLKGLLKEISPDILHTQLFAADILGRLTGKMLQIPVIITSIRNIYYGGFGRYFLFKLTEWCADRTTFVSRAALDRFVELKVVPAEKAVLIYNGLDTGRFYHGLSGNEKLAWRRKQGLPGEGCLFLAVGSLTRQKGYGVLFKALRELKQKGFMFNLVIAGQGPLKQELEAEVKELGLSGQVTFLGRSGKVPELMAWSDLLVLASFWEGLPGVVLEAMASELPVVATAVGGTPELVVEGKTGYLVQPSEPEQLARALEKVLELSTEERLALGQAGRARVEENFSLDKMVKAYETLYEETLREKILGKGC